MPKTFICIGCKRELPVKYVYKTNVCVDCYKEYDKLKLLEKNDSVCARCGTDLHLLNSKQIVRYGGKLYCDVCASYLTDRPKTCEICNNLFPESETTVINKKRVCNNCQLNYLRECYAFNTMSDHVPELIPAIDAYYSEKDNTFNIAALNKICKTVRSCCVELSDPEKLFSELLKDHCKTVNLQLLGFISDYMKCLTVYSVGWVIDNDFILALCDYGGQANGHDEFFSHTDLVVCKKTDQTKYNNIKTEKLEFETGNYKNRHTVRLTGSMMLHASEGIKNDFELHNYYSYQKYLLISPFEADGAWFFERFEYDSRY